MSCSRTVHRDSRGAPLSTRRMRWGFGTRPAGVERARDELCLTSGAAMHVCKVVMAYEGQ